MKGALLEKTAVGKARLRLVSLPRLSIEHLWAMAALAGILWSALATPLQPLDFWWHLKVGEVIYTTGSIPRTDLFSFTAQGREFVYQNWLSELAYYLTYKLGGLPSIVLLNALAVTTAFGLALYLCWEATHDVRRAVLCTLLAEALGIRFTNARPQAFSFPLFMAFYLVLQRYRHRRGNLLWLLPPFMALWANVHGAFVLGLVLLSIVLCAELAKRLLRGPHAEALSFGEIAYLGLILLATLLATGLNPEGYGVFAYVRAVQSDPASQNLVTEWQVPSIKRLGDLPFFAVLFLGFIAFIYSAQRPDLTDLALFSVFAGLALSSVRHIIWFALIVAPILARHVACPHIIRKRRPPSRERTKGLNYLIAVLLILITVLLSPWVRPRLRHPRLGYGLVDPRTPVEAMEFIEERGIGGRIFHPQHYGDYLIWRLYPQQRAFIDGRVHLYGHALCRDYIRILSACDWEKLLAKYRIQFLLLDKSDDGEGRLLQAVRGSDAWKPIYQDDLCIMYKRRE